MRKHNIGGKVYKKICAKGTQVGSKKGIRCVYITKEAIVCWLHELCANWIVDGRLLSEASRPPFLFYSSLPLPLHHHVPLRPVH